MRVDDVRQDILTIAKDEFMQMGFSGSSMRVIAKRAHLTTGAVYNRFEDKSDLFSALVSEPAEELLSFFSSISCLFTKETSQKLSELLSSKRDEYILLFFKSFGSVYENYSNQLSDTLAIYLKKNQEENSLSDSLCLTIATSISYGMQEIVKSQSAREDMEKDLLEFFTIFQKGCSTFLGDK